MSLLRAFAPAALLFLLVATPTPAQMAGLNTLQGRWVVTGAEAGGEPFDTVVGGVLTVAGADFTIRTAAGNVLTGTLTADAARTPAALDLLHADGARWAAIYEIDGERLRLAYVVDDGTAPRPQVFSTGGEMLATRIDLERSNQ
jgi:uncharacterized protein (TIGR03067 family)